ncbi:hypothetical protein, partial [Companilactobacillus musae]|uniref:hypothetical protein n=1 Tax=Companilactobacillus musae TaxID=1903258 RepID=UPI0013C2FC27
MTATYGPEGAVVKDAKGNTVTANNPASYTGKSFSIDVPDGKVGDSVTLNIPNYDNDGYTAPVLTATYGPDGAVVKDANGNTVTANNPASYTGKSVSNNKAIAVINPTTGKSISIDVPDGKVGDSVTLNIPNYDNDGYTAPVLTATYGPDGAVVKDANGNTVTADNPASYTAKTISNNKAVAVTDPTTGKSISIDVPDGKVGDSVTLKIPNYDNDGYIAPVLTATYGPSGVVVKDANGNTITADDPATYTAKTIS